MKIWTCMMSVRYQAITWTNAGLLWIRPLGAYLSGIWTKIEQFLLKNMDLNMSLANWRPVYLHTRPQCVNTGSENRMLSSEGTLPEPMITYHQWGLVLWHSLDGNFMHGAKALYHKHPQCWLNIYILYLTSMTTTDFWWYIAVTS